RRGVVIGEHLEPLTVMVLEHTRHEMHGGVVAEVAGQVSDPDTPRATAANAPGDSLHLRHDALDVGTRYSQVAGLISTPCYVCERKFLGQGKLTGVVPGAELALQDFGPLPVTGEARRHERAADQACIIRSHLHD